MFYFSLLIAGTFTLNSKYEVNVQASFILYGKDVLTHFYIVLYKMGQDFLDIRGTKVDIK